MVEVEAPQVSSPKPERRRFGVLYVLLIAVMRAAAGAAIARSFPLTFSDEGESTGKGEAALYQCPMHPTIVSDHPSNCPICGMKLVKVDAPSPSAAVSTEHNVSEGSALVKVPGMATVEIDPNRQQLIGLTTTEITSGPVGGAWRTVGRVAVDETRVRNINLKVAGFVERIHVDFVGKKVRKGDPLFSVYSPELLLAQEEYLLAVRTKAALSRASATPESASNNLVAAARRKLSLWDVPNTEIERLASTGEPQKTLTFYSPISGVVTRKDVVQGMKLDAGAMPYEIVDLASVWVLADVYESELRYVKERMGATLTLNAYPDETFNGTVAFMDPLMDPATRTVKVRLTFANPKGELRPEMFGEVTLHGASREAPRVPLDAVIDSGKEKVAFVAIGDGKFQPRAVKIGQSDGSFAEVLEGLKAGERVVTRANFLVDSESRLRASLAEMSTSVGARPIESARVLPAPAASSQALPDASSGAPRSPSSSKQHSPSTGAHEPPLRKAPEHSGHQH